MTDLHLSESKLGALGGYTVQMCLDAAAPYRTHLPPCKTGPAVHATLQYPTHVGARAPYQYVQDLCHDALHVLRSYCSMPLAGTLFGSSTAAAATTSPSGPTIASYGSRHAQTAYFASSNMAAVYHQSGFQQHGRYQFHFPYIRMEHRCRRFPPPTRTAPYCCQLPNNYRHFPSSSVRSRPRSRHPNHGGRPRGASPSLSAVYRQPSLSVFLRHPSPHRRIHLQCVIPSTATSDPHFGMSLSHPARVAPLLYPPPPFHYPAPKISIKSTSPDSRAL